VNRLQDLLNLRNRVDNEIRAEQARRARVSELSARMDPVEPPEPSTALASEIRDWLTNAGYTPPATGMLSAKWRILYAEVVEQHQTESVA
jgi:hypothetical protein